MAVKIRTYKRKEAIGLINHYEKEGIPFVFLISYDMEASLILPAEEAAQQGFHLEMPGYSNQPVKIRPERKLELEKYPVSPERYRQAFDFVMEQIQYGNSFLVNLTFPTCIESNYSIQEMFDAGKAPFKLCLEGELVVFSPERFIRIEECSIIANPMKGTMDAGIPDAVSRLLKDAKEDAEHHTIVDLIRNDLSQVAEHVRVERLKYIESLQTHQGELLQMSSEITGMLSEGFETRLGEIIFTLLPAGSICGAPKKKTLEIIREAEGCERGFYTGIFGYRAGSELEAAVAIRYVEKGPTGLVFKSGGGITFQSDCEQEYEEMLKKVYVPVY